MDLSRLTSVDPREVWPNEAADFTPWLLENADVLADALGLDIELTEREYQVGDYFLDLIGLDRTNDCPLVVENQLSRTDHSHLGQLLTYAAGTDAKTIVWVAPAFREEHRQAVDFLNSLAEGSARFFAVEVAVVRIGASAAAPLLRLVAKPNDWHAVASSSARTAGEASERGRLYLSLWRQVVDAVHAASPELERTRRLGPRNWLVVDRPTAGVDLSCSFARNGRIRVELYIGRGSAEENKSLFDRLFAERETLETAIGEPLAWESLEGRRACRIAIYRDGDVSSVDEHAAYSSWMAEGVQRFRRVFTPERLSMD